MFLIDLVQLRRERGAPLHAEEGVNPGRELRLAAQHNARRVAVDACELVRRGRLVRILILKKAQALVPALMP